MAPGIERTAALIAAEHREGKDFHTPEGLPDLETAYRVQKLYLGEIIGNDGVGGSNPSCGTSISAIISSIYLEPALTRRTSYVELVGTGSAP